MHASVIVVVLVAALLHATWNALLKGAKTVEIDRAQVMCSMSVVVGLLALAVAPFVPLPTRSAWVCVAISTALHVVYNLLLLQNYRMADFASAYPIARGASPLLVSLGGLVLMQQRMSAAAVAGVAMISAGIVYLATGKGRMSGRATASAVATGVVIAAYTVVDGMGVRRSATTLSYTAWVFAGYLLTPLVMRLLRFKVRVLAVEGLRRAFGAGVFSLVAYSLVLWATHYADIGVVSALRETSVLWAVVIGRVFLGEAFTWRRAVSAVVICGGVGLLLGVG